MDDLVDRLRELGVKIGAAGISPTNTRVKPNLHEILGGDLYHNNHGEYLLISTAFPYSSTSITINPKIETAYLQKSTNLSITDNPLTLEDYFILDIETTGMIGSAGVYIFLIGLGEYKCDRIEVLQFLLPHPSDELAQLLAFEQIIHQKKGLVTYNGKSFDLPILNNRYTFNLLPAPVSNQIHIDLLHTTRKLWKRRLESRSLRNIEANLLNINRSMDDIPGWLIPDIYTHYLQTGDPSELGKVIYHNQMDIYSLAILYSYVNQHLQAKGIIGNYYPEDILSTGIYFEEIGEIDIALAIYRQGINNHPPIHILCEICERIAQISKQRNNYIQAIEMWRIAAELSSLKSLIELAKYYEHKLNNFNEAIKWTALAIDLNYSHPDVQRRYGISSYALQHRLKRLINKKNS